MIFGGPQNRNKKVNRGEKRPWFSAALLARFGLIRHRWGAHHFCRKECLERFKRRLDAEVKRRKFLAWLSGRSGH